ncbi:hypothetical protein [Sphingobacterium sp. HSC-15S19]|uniref:hypothetical protein n=1 Tax=Sphingobacterium sp. HSC-15S19 TaxID=2910971 RepID=UPI003D196811
MKRISILIFVLLCTVLSFGQGYQRVGMGSSYHLGNDYYLYLNTHFTFDSSYPKGNWSFVFLSKQDAVTGTRSKSLKSEELSNIKFSVAEIEDLGDGKILMTLLGDAGQVRYFLYHQNMSNWFPFMVQDIDYSSSSICDKITVSQDKFTKSKRYTIPYKRGRGYDLYVTTEKGKPAVISLYLSTSGSTVNVGENEVKLLLEDDKVITKKSVGPIDVEVGEYGYNYSAVVEISEAEAYLFSKTKIKEFRLFVYDSTISEHDSEMLRRYMKCILEMIDKKNSSN